MPQIAVARLWFEGNSFAPEPTPLAAFQGREWLSGPEALSRYSGTATELGALAGFVAERPDWQVAMLRCAAAQPGGPMSDLAFDAWMSEVEEGLARGQGGSRWDGVYLSLHGACVTESDPEADLTIIRRVRAVIGPRAKLVASFDFHGNVSPQMIGLLDGASVYRTYPHVDMAETALRALRLLERALAGHTNHGSLMKLPALLHSFHMRDAEGPMAEVWAEALAAEQPPILDASLFGGFAWGDSPHAGPSAMVWAEEHGAARALARQLIASIGARRARFAVTLPSPEAALSTALAAPPGLVALLDPADNPLSGGVADTPGLLRLLMQAQPEVETVFCFLHDPEGVAAARAAGLGSAFARDLGGRTTAQFGPPVPFSGVVEALTHGRFLNTGPMEHGAPVDLGPTALLRAGKLRVVLTSRKEAAVDPAFFALHGIDLGQVRLLVNKAKNHFRAAFASRCSAIVECDVPGPAALDLAALPFRHVPAGWRQG
ncbi:M81 family metallopeptidase [Sediminicoccus sp. KRV36]|uniref:M81 family metallopeptidase n=1 Tax=Sediminicoccus sp. KRV36 TaxID=3133721 RepID=UPI00200C9E4D|nr:M81 family metallopeptidase [Sediminicoccus rosea]UPY37285.1 M81 family metallopeptidase [Sediminicoccus rosea]